MLLLASALFAQPLDSRDSTENVWRNAAPFLEATAMPPAAITAYNYGSVGIEGTTSNYPALELRGYTGRDIASAGAGEMHVAFSLFANLAYSRTTAAFALPLGFGSAVVVGNKTLLGAFGLGTETGLFAREGTYFLDFQNRQTPAWTLPLVVDAAMLWRFSPQLQAKVFVRPVLAEGAVTVRFGVGLSSLFY